MKPIEELVLPAQDAIVTRIEARKEGDPFNFEVGIYVNYLDFAHAKPFLKTTATAEAWADAQAELPFTKDALLKEMKAYWPFAWDKANNCRGISANRSIMHYIAWTWLIGDDEFSKYLEDLFERDYKHYGKPILEKVGERYGWEWKDLDNGKRVNKEGE